MNEQPRENSVSMQPVPPVSPKRYKSIRVMNIVVAVFGSALLAVMAVIGWLFLQANDEQNCMVGFALYIFMYMAFIIGAIIAIIIAIILPFYILKRRRVSEVASSRRIFPLSLAIGIVILAWFLLIACAIIFQWL
jgi:zinc transporter ZupT